MEHMRDMMMLIALGGAVTYGWKENFCRCAITASSFWSKMLLSQSGIPSCTLDGDTRMCMCTFYNTLQANKG